MLLRCWELHLLVDCVGVVTELWFSAFGTADLDVVDISMGVEDGFGLTVTVADAADLDPVKGTLDLVHLATHTHLDLLLRISITLANQSSAFFFS